MRSAKQGLCGGQCGVLVKAPAPAVSKATPFGPGIHALAIYLKGFQALSYKRLHGTFRDFFGLSVSEGTLMNMFIRSQPAFKIEADKAIAILRQAKVVASDETGVRIEGTNSGAKKVPVAMVLGVTLHGHGGRDKAFALR